MALAQVKLNRQSQIWGTSRSSRFRFLRENTHYIRFSGLITLNSGRLAALVSDCGTTCITLDDSSSRRERPAKCKAASSEVNLRSLFANARPLSYSRQTAAQPRDGCFS